MEVSICHMGRRKDTTVNRSLPVDKYKRLTLGETKIPEPRPSTPPPIVMASNAPAPTPAAAPTPMEVSSEPAAAPVAAPAEASPSAPTEATKMAAENPIQYMEIFEKVIKTLPENEKEIFIKAQLGELKNSSLFFCFFSLVSSTKKIGE